MNIALILAGGTGARLGEIVPKQYIEVEGKPIIYFCLETFAVHPKIDAIQIVADVTWHTYLQCLIENEFMRGKCKGISKKGENRQTSIWNALEDILQYASKEDLVIIHDAVRPFVTAGFINESLEKVAGHDGVLPVLPMKDTVYFSKDGNKVSTLVDRNCMFAGQAPEIFRLGKYYEANRELLPDEILRINGSAEPAIISGMDIVMIEGDEENFKITTKEDLRRFKNKLEWMKFDKTMKAGINDEEQK